MIQKELKRNDKEWRVGEFLWGGRGNCAFRSMGRSTQGGRGNKTRGRKTSIYGSGRGWKVRIRGGGDRGEGDPR